MATRTLRTLFIVGAMVWMSAVASAQSVNDSLQSMFDSWGVVTTAIPGAYESQSRGYLAAGAYSNSGGSVCYLVSGTKGIGGSNDR